VFGDLDALLNAADIHALDIASPVGTHAPFALKAVQRGAHTLCQKPLCATLAQARALVDALPASPRLMVHENWRFRPWYRIVRGWLAALRVGTVRQVRLSWFNAGLLPDAAGALPIFARQPYMAQLPRLIVGEVLIHHLDTLRWLFGSLAVRAATLAYGCPVAAGESAATILLDGAAHETIVLEGNMMAHGYPSRPLDRCEILGDAGRILLADDTLALECTHPERHTFDLDAAYQSSFDAVIDHFVDALRTGAPFETHPADNLETLELVEDVYAATRTATVGP
jgi:predicted dehydrogenase